MSTNKDKDILTFSGCKKDFKHDDKSFLTSEFKPIFKTFEVEDNEEEAYSKLSVTVVVNGEVKKITAK
jgi:hypothetical protein